MKLPLYGKLLQVCETKRNLSVCGQIRGPEKHCVKMFTNVRKDKIGTKRTGIIIRLEIYNIFVLIL